MVRKSLRFLLGLAAVASFIFVVAMLIPRTKKRSRSLFIDANPKTLFNAVLDSQKQQEWRSNLRDIQVRQRRKKWIETLPGNIEVEYQVTRTTPNELIELAFYSDAGFSGKTIIEIVEHDGGSNVTFTEYVDYDRWFAAFLACLANLFDMGMDRYINDLKAYLEEENQEEEEEEEEGLEEEETGSKKRLRRRHG